MMGCMEKCPVNNTIYGSRTRQERLTREGKFSNQWFHSRVGNEFASAPIVNVRRFFPTTIGKSTFVILSMFQEKFRENVESREMEEDQIMSKISLLITWER